MLQRFVREGPWHGGSHRLTEVHDSATAVSEHTQRSAGSAAALSPCRTRRRRSSRGGVRQGPACPPQRRPLRPPRRLLRCSDSMGVWLTAVLPGCTAALQGPKALLLLVLAGAAKARSRACLAGAAAGRWPRQQRGQAGSGEVDPRGAFAGAKDCFLAVRAGRFQRGPACDTTKQLLWAAYSNCTRSSTLWRMLSQIGMRERAKIPGIGCLALHPRAPL